ncbi:MAG: riboflavin synthase [Lautropia sp.]|nr:riboflavin synthase [Lautropia sp.]
MFTGIVSAVGHINRVEALGDQAGVRLHLDAGGLDLRDVGIGDSIAVSGACMTVVSLSGQGFVVDVSAESLRRTHGLAEPGPVNLEKAMRLADRVGGHLVSGHVDGVGIVRRFEPVGESHLLEILAPAALARYLVYKGSVTVDGVSLTVNHVEDVTLASALEGAWADVARQVLAPQAEDGAECCAFQINLIPHTVAVTTLKRLVPGAKVNLEIDQVARYLSRMQDVDARQAVLASQQAAMHGKKDDKA